MEPRKALTKVEGSDHYFIDRFRIDKEPKDLDFATTSNIVEYMVISEPRCAIKD